MQLEVEMTGAQARACPPAQARDDAAHAASEVMARVATLEERRRSAASSLTRIQSMAGEVNRRINNLHGQLESASAEKQQRASENEKIAVQLVEWAAERERIQAGEAQLQSEGEGIRARLLEIEEALKAARVELDRVRDQRADVLANAARLQSDLEHMSETCVQELSVKSRRIAG